MGSSSARSLLCFFNLGGEEEYPLLDPVLLKEFTPEAKEDPECPIPDAFLFL